MNTDIPVTTTHSDVVVVVEEEALQARDTVNDNALMPFLNVPKDIEMDILDVAEINVETTINVGEEPDVGSHIAVLEESLNFDVEDEVAQNDMGPHDDEDLAPLFFPSDMPEKERQRRQVEHNYGLPSQFRSDEWRYQWRHP